MPDIKETVSLAGVADILDVSRQRAAELVKRDGFPAPVEETALGRRWLRSAVQEWDRDRERT